MRPLKNPRLAEPEQEFLIMAVGHAGDGMARLADGSFAAIPFALPGETVRAAGRDRRYQLQEILAASPDRVTPPCPHFGQCGGCVLQHWNDAQYAAWKRGLAVSALERAGFSAPNVLPLQRTPPASRRRIDFAVHRGARLALGLHARGSGEILDIETCAILHPDIARLLPSLRAMLPTLPGIRGEASCLINLLDSGPDLLIRSTVEASTEDRTRLAAFGVAESVPRIAWASGNSGKEIVAQTAPSFLHFGEIRVEPPPGAFLQASGAGEAAIVQAVLDGMPPKLKSRSRIVELYAGCGTLSFPMSDHAQVLAYEGDPAAHASLARAAGGRRIRAIKRDLARQPLQKPELAAASAIVLDPPYPGAASQMGPIAASGVRRVIYISCNPAALARDATTLRQAGYVLDQAAPVDQFLWSAQLEMVCVFSCA